ncbi:hypothetical protein LINPERPRIM_LOCUS7812 [Linum perenne]
MSSTAVKPTML